MLIILNTIERSKIRLWLHYQSCYRKWIWATYDYPTSDCWRTNHVPMSFVCPHASFYNVKLGLKRSSGSIPAILLPNVIAHKSRNVEQLPTKATDLFVPNQTSKSQQLTRAAKRNKNTMCFLSLSEALVLSSWGLRLPLVFIIRAFPYVSVHRCYDWDVTCFDSTFPNHVTGQVRDRVTAEGNTTPQSAVAADVQRNRTTIWC